MEGKAMLKRFEEWLRTQGWHMKLNAEANLNFNEDFIGRYPDIGSEYEDFLRIYKEVVSADEKTWFLCGDDYNGASEAAFKWNEFENLSLEAAGDDSEWKDEIKEWWDKKLPIVISVKDGYSFYAIDLENGRGSIVRGKEPEFEETEVVAGSFFDFLDMVIRGEETIC